MYYCLLETFCEASRLIFLAALITPTQQEYVVSVPPEDAVVERGGEALFYCKITGDPEVSSIWAFH